MRPRVSACPVRFLIHVHSADTTRYGAHSTHDFYGHHAAAISLAIVTGEAEAIVNGVSRRETAWVGGGHPWLNAVRALQCTQPRGLRAA